MGALTIIDKDPDTLGGNGRGGDGLLAACVGRVGDASHMPELGEDKPTLGVDRIGDQAPACDLLGAVDARCPGIALAQRLISGCLR